MPNTTPAARRHAPARLLAAAALAAAAAAGCNDILEVDNPNNVNAEALSNPASATNQVNGVLAALTRGANQLVGHQVTASDEMTWSGSLDFMNQLNRGFVRDPYNEFITDAATGMSTARYMANRTIKQLEQFQTDRTLTDPVQLALANLYAAVTYDYIANGFDNFVIDSDRQQGGQAVGADKMAVLYDSADAAATRALALAPAANALLRGQILAVRARARYDKAVWQKVNPSGKAPADPLVNVQGAVDDATAALPLLGADGRLALTVVSGMSYGNCFLPSCTNSRREIAFGPLYGSYAYTTTRTLTVNLRDPVSNQPDPALAALMTEFVTGTNNNNQLTSLVVTGARDMRLILAEAALARGSTAEFTTQINALRALNAKPAWSGAVGQPSARDLLVHERRVNLYLQGRRLTDMYRFGITDPEWSAQSDAASCPGSLFPIVDAERQTNANVADVQPACGQ
jgi:starch-binding outer membrane protein, SusD/RagB family